MYEPGDVWYGTTDVQRIWDESIPFKQLIRSYITMVLHPRRSLRMLNFAGKMLVMNRIRVKGGSR